MSHLYCSGVSVLQSKCSDNRNSRRERTVLWYRPYGTSRKYTRNIQCTHLKQYNIVTIERKGERKKEKQLLRTDGLTARVYNSNNNNMMIIIICRAAVQCVFSTMARAYILYTIQINIRKRRTRGAYHMSFTRTMIAPKLRFFLLH